MASITEMGTSFYKGRRQSLEQYGDQLLFYVKALAWAPRAIRRYPREITKTLAEVTFGAGALTLIAGSVGVIAFHCSRACSAACLAIAFLRQMLLRVAVLLNLPRQVCA